MSVIGTASHAVLGAPTVDAILFVPTLTLVADARRSTLDVGHDLLLVEVVEEVVDVALIEL